VSAKRHLAAIVAADVVGYARLMGADERGTLETFRSHRRQLIDPLVAAHRGQVVKTAGDGLLLSFASVVEAVACAVAIQSGMADRNREVPAEKRIDFRIGVNIGDVIVEKGDVFGDGVNIAARLEQIAPPGGICLSEDAYRQVRSKLDVPFVDAGEQQLKNISSPVRVYLIEPAWLAAAGLPSPRIGQGRWRAAAIMAAAAGVGAFILAGAAWLALVREAPDNLSAPPGRMAVSGAPVIAVLPFANQTGDEGQDYFADGVTEEVINALGRFGSLRVIGVNAVMRYKKEPAGQDKAASDLGASYAVNGSVRRATNRVRIAVQLTDTRAGFVMWSERYDGELKDVFEFQDTIARQIAGTLAANIAAVEARRSLAQPKPNPNAFDLVLRARAVARASTRAANRKSRELLMEAIELDPNYALAHALLADALYSMVVLGWTEFPDREFSRGAASARKAIELAPDEPDGYRALGRISLGRAEYDQAQNALKRALELNPSDANALATWGTVQSFTGDIAGAIESLELALKLDPTLEPNHVFDLALAYYLARRHQDALSLAEHGLARHPDFPMFNLPAVAAAAQLGDKEAVARHLGEIRRRMPHFQLDRFGSRFKDPSHSEYLREGLRLAGL
jgi:class 3 adenylate cyclase/TolB-like protein/Tfp pilus assembly protein PilF